VICLVYSLIDCVAVDVVFKFSRKSDGHQRNLEVLVNGRGALVGRDFGRRLSRTGIMVDYHWEPLRDPMGRGDPHDRRRALDLDDPKPKLS